MKLTDDKGVTAAIDFSIECKCPNPGCCHEIDIVQYLGEVEPDDNPLELMQKWNTGISPNIEVECDKCYCLFTITDFEY